MCHVQEGGGDCMMCVEWCLLADWSVTGMSEVRGRLRRSFFPFIDSVQKVTLPYIVHFLLPEPYGNIHRD